MAAAGSGWNPAPVTVFGLPVIKMTDHPVILARRRKVSSRMAPGIRKRAHASRAIYDSHDRLPCSAGNAGRAPLAQVPLLGTESRRAWLGHDELRARALLLGPSARANRGAGLRTVGHGPRRTRRCPVQRLVSTALASRRASPVPGRISQWQPVPAGLAPAVGADPVRVSNSTNPAPHGHTACSALIRVSASADRSRASTSSGSGAGRQRRLRFATARSLGPAICPQKGIFRRHVAA